MATRTTNMWAYGSGVDMQQTQSCEGYDVHATDGDIGTVSESTSEVGRNSIVVDTGMWIFGKKRLIPAACVRSVDHANRRIDVSLTKDQIKDAPDAKGLTERDTKDDDAYYDSHAGYYRTWI